MSKIIKPVAFNSSMLDIVDMHNEMASRAYWCQVDGPIRRTGLNTGGEPMIFRLGLAAITCVLWAVWVTL